MLDPTFKFSQHSLSDFVECPRRFYLHYVARQPWPIVEKNPLNLGPLDYQRYLWRGTVLHRWIERYWLGIPPQMVDDAELCIWWDHFQSVSFDHLPANRLPELALVAPIGNHLLYARFDMLAFDPHASDPHAIIVDWKTWRAQRPPRHQIFAKRLQTRIYLYVLATAGAAFNGGQRFAPEQCSMRYWLANFPDQPWVELPYSATDYAQDQSQLLDLIERASSGKTEEDYPSSPNESYCPYCTYRTLCGHNGAPVSADDECFDVDAIAELDY